MARKKKGEPVAERIREVQPASFPDPKGMDDGTGEEGFDPGIEPGKGPQDEAAPLLTDEAKDAKDLPSYDEAEAASKAEPFRVTPRDPGSEGYFPGMDGPTMTLSSLQQPRIPEEGGGTLPMPATEDDGSPTPLRATAGSPRWLCKLPGGNPELEIPANDETEASREYMKRIGVISSDHKVQVTRLTEPKP